MFLLGMYVYVIRIAGIVYADHAITIADPCIVSFQQQFFVVTSAASINHQSVILVKNAQNTFICFVNAYHSEDILLVDLSYYQADSLVWVHPCLLYTSDAADEL